MDEINEFREDLLDKISKLRITEEERTITKRLQSIKRDNMKWQALSVTSSQPLIPYSVLPHILFSKSTRTTVQYLQKNMRIQGRSFHYEKPYRKKSCTDKTLRHQEVF